jgi:hypothetical protein
MDSKEGRGMNVTQLKRWPGRVRSASAVATMLMTGLGGSAMPPLKPNTLEGWARYVSAVEARRSDEWRQRVPGRDFAMDAMPAREAERQRLLNGELVVARVESAGTHGSIDVPSALVHHWRGAVFIPGISLAELVTRLETEPPPTGPEVPKRGARARPVVHEGVPSTSADEGRNGGV